MKKAKLQGVGIGLRASHYTFINDFKPTVPWFEILSDNYLLEGGPSLFHLEKICETYPITFHGVGMSLGSTDALNETYLSKLKLAIQRFKPLMVSDHLSWTSLQGRYFHELLPLPYTEEAVNHVARRIIQVQESLGQKIMIENVSNYLSYKHSIMPEWEFLQAVADAADCNILLDINNIFVSAFNNHFDPREYIHGLSSRRILQFHLGGHEDKGSYLFDTHSEPVHQNVWTLFQEAIQKFGPLLTSIERDNNIPHFLDLYKESQQAKTLLESCRLNHDYDNA